VVSGTVMLAGAAYLAIGVGFGALAGGAASLEARTLWRLGAWAASALVFAAHVGQVRLRWGRLPRASALQAALGAAVGALGLAIAGPARMALVEGHGGRASGLDPGAGALAGDHRHSRVHRGTGRCDVAVSLGVPEPWFALRRPPN
jgi:hypothetical protein